MYRVIALLASASVMAGAGPAKDPPSLFAQQTAQADRAAVGIRLKRVATAIFSGTARIDESIHELKAILALDPRSAEAHFLLGVAYRAAGSPDMMAEAKAELRQALALDPGLVPARLHLAQAYLDFGQPKRAREELEIGLTQIPRQPQFLALLGEAERRLGNPHRSVEVTRQALQTDQSFGQARYYLALSLLDLDQHAEGIQELERLVRAGEEQIDIYLSLGTAYLSENRIEDALRTLGRGVQLNGSRSDVRIQLAKAYRVKGLLDQADEQLTLAAPAGAAAVSSPYYQYQQGESDFLLEQGLLRLSQGRPKEAADAFRKVLAKDAQNEQAQRHLADAQEKLRQP
jgi:tetratricopeptide (TPR) repeat protein